MENKFQATVSRILRAAPLQYFVIAVLAIIYAFSLEIFVYPNDFAPTGISGVATMIQYSFGISVGYLSLLINLPMLIVAFFVISRRYAIRNAVFILVFSVSSILLRQADLGSIRYVAQDGGSAILASVAGGFLCGLAYSLTIRLGASTGGVDIIAAFFNKRWPEFDMVWIIFTMNAIVAGASFFVYGYNYTAVILCIINSYVCSRVGDSMIKGTRTAAKFEVVTTHPEELSKELLHTLHHGCTVIPAKGAYTGEGKSVLLCVVNRRQVVEFEQIIRRYDDTFAIVSTVNSTVGKFWKIK